MLLSECRRGSFFMVFEKADKVLYIIILKLLRYLRHGQIAGQQHIFCHLQLLLTDHVGKGDSSFFFQYLRYVIGLVVQCVRTFVQRNISPGFLNHCRYLLHDIRCPGLAECSQRMGNRPNDLIHDKLNQLFFIVYLRRLDQYIILFTVKHVVDRQ